MEPEDVAREVAKMPAAPRTDEASYALVSVHAWSFGRDGGPRLEAVHRTIGLLPPRTSVVTADQLIALLRANFGARHAGEPRGEGREISSTSGISLPILLLWLVMPISCPAMAESARKEKRMQMISTRSRPEDRSRLPGNR